MNAEKQIEIELKSILLWMLLQVAAVVATRCCGCCCYKVFSLSNTDELRREEMCADTIGQSGRAVMMRHCHGYRGNQQWKHDRVITSIYYLFNPSATSVSQSVTIQYNIKLVTRHM